MSPTSAFRTLGRNGPKVSAMGFGLESLSTNHYGAYPSDLERFKVYDRALELGVTFWDSSDLYGDSEEIVGKWIKRTGKRDDIFIATKFGYIVGNGRYTVDSSAAYCKKACDASLKRLGIDSIDLFYAHNVNPETPIEETMRAMKELQAEGKIKHIGLSAVSAATLRRAYKIAPIAAYQTDYSVFMRGIEGPEGGNLLSTCRELGIAVIAAMPLGRGMITAAFSNGTLLTDEKDSRAQRMPRFQGANGDVNARAVAKLAAFADAKEGCVSVSHLAIAWLLKQGDDIIPIPGTKQIANLETNRAAVDLVLNDDEEREIRTFVEGVNIAGGVVPPGMEDFYYRDTKEEGTA
ncbi:putative aldo-keto reductase [Xylaria cf. heliscus]|nr:putative aldo-keto reductase [Xylaria cf. heliscus]